MSGTIDWETTPLTCPVCGQTEPEVHYGVETVAEEDTPVIFWVVDGQSCSCGHLFNNQDL